MTGVFSGCWLRAKGYRLLPAPAAGTAFACIPPGKASPIALPLSFWVGIEVNHVYRAYHPFAAGGNRETDFAIGIAEIRSVSYSIGHFIPHPHFNIGQWLTFKQYFHFHELIVADGIGMGEWNDI